jgi:integration host factor subunit beta
MTRSELIAKLAAHYPQLVAKDAEAAVKTILEAMTTALERCRRIEIRGFGSFAINHHPPRTGRNPKTGEKVPVPEKFVPHFKAGSCVVFHEARGCSDVPANDLGVMLASHAGFCFDVAHGEFSGWCGEIATPHVRPSAKELSATRSELGECSDRTQRG